MRKLLRIWRLFDTFEFDSNYIVFSKLNYRHMKNIAFSADEKLFDEKVYVNFQRLPFSMKISLQFVCRIWRLVADLRKSQSFELNLANRK